MSTLALISVSRPDEWFGRMRKVNCILDGEVVAQLRIGETAGFKTEPGTHSLQVQMDWCTSPEVSITVKAGERLSFHTKSPGFWRRTKLMRTDPGRFFQLLPSEQISG